MLCKGPTSDGSLWFSFFFFVDFEIGIDAGEITAGGIQRDVFFSEESPRRVSFQMGISSDPT